MNILHINARDSGGAAKACLRLHMALLRKGMNSKVLLLENHYHTPEVYAFNYWDNTPTRFSATKKGIEYFLYDRQLRQRNLPYHTEEFSFPNTVYDVTSSRHYAEADIVQLNWTSGFLDEPSFFLKNHKPTVWRMADLYICGGGNHYEKGFPIDSFESYINKNIEIRRKALSHPHINLNLVPISNWTKLKAEESSLTSRFPKKVIQCGVEMDIYSPCNKDIARKALNLPLNKKIILFGAENVDNPRKGTALLIEALTKLENQKNIHVVSFGRNNLNIENVNSIGTISDEKLLALLFSAVDIYVTPSIEETFGQTSIEALACGTPIISFPTGGGLEIIKNGLNGFLAKDFDSDSLARAIQLSLDTDFDLHWIREDTVARFNIDDKADEYIDLYQSIINK